MRVHYGHSSAAIFHLSLWSTLPYSSRLVLSAVLFAVLTTVTDSPSCIVVYQHHPPPSSCCIVSQSSVFCSVYT
ncbi:hypothetical protein BD311DRAFT_749259 [Dichomitus squalens]|uniref:Uncharacterized protein n=1 Tax=Dichomitus squalens TaxID=114155 RepID=A0A4Q9N1S5_9APHY|nr:hypothetical protein BD311DRAFT_749259 [Dichomitus squalens]